MIVFALEIYNLYIHAVETKFPEVETAILEFILNIGIKFTA